MNTSENLRGVESGGESLGDPQKERDFKKAEFKKLIAEYSCNVSEKPEWQVRGKWR